MVYFQKFLFAPFLHIISEEFLTSLDHQNCNCNSIIALRFRHVTKLVQGKIYTSHTQPNPCTEMPMVERLMNNNRKCSYARNWVEITNLASCLSNVTMVREIGDVNAYCMDARWNSQLRWQQHHNILEISFNESIVMIWKWIWREWYTSRKLYTAFSRLLCYFDY